MSPIREQLDKIKDRIPKSGRILLFKMAKGFTADDLATEDDKKAIRAARAEYTKGETVSHKNINWN